jgi:hypothetical protein
LAALSEGAVVKSKVVKRLRVVFCVGTAMVAACGGSAGGVAGDAGGIGDAVPSASGGGSIGAIDGTEFVVRAQSATLGKAPDVLNVGLTTESGTECGPVHSGAWALELYVFAYGGGPLRPGIYSGTLNVDGGPIIDAVLDRYGPACSRLTPPDAGADAGTLSGTITVTSLSPRVVGSFDLDVFGLHLAGAIDAVICGPDAATGVGTLDACQ